MFFCVLIGALAILSSASNPPLGIKPTQDDENFVENEYFIPKTLRDILPASLNTLRVKKYKNGQIESWNNEVGKFLYLAKWYTSYEGEPQVRYLCMIPVKRGIFEKQFVVSQYLSVPEFQPENKKKPFQLTFVTKLTAKLKDQIILLIRVSKQKITQLVFNSKSEVNRIIHHRFGSLCLNQGINYVKFQLIRPKKQKRTAAFIGFSQVELRFQRSDKPPQMKLGIIDECNVEITKF